MLYFANKGLFIKKLDDDLYTIQDIFGTCSLPFESSEKDLDEVTKQVANVKKLVTVGVDSESPDLSDFKWSELEFYYVVHINHVFLASLINSNEAERYHLVKGLFPIGYLDCGYGDGSKNTLELIHNNFKELCKDDDFPVQKKDLELFLINNQVERICSDIMSLMRRSVFSYTELLRSQRKCIEKSYKAIDELETNEVLHRSYDSHQASSAVTSLVISLCSSLDLSTKLIQYINSIEASGLTYKTARDKQYHEVKNIKEKFISEKVLKFIAKAQNSNIIIPEITQFRNDLIHSTSLLEIEKIYVGVETDEIKNLPLYYSAQYARDTLGNGQPVRFLGRDYFVQEKVDIEEKILSWVNSVFEYHIDVGRSIYNYLKSIEKP